MLDFFGQRDAFCDGLGRRDFLKVGCLGLGGLSLAQVLRAQAFAKTSNTRSAKKTNVILVWLGGGPSHIDMWDLKPNAPAEIRGEFNPIASSLPGVQVGEHLPLSAKHMDKVALLRSVSHIDADHGSAAHYILTGYEPTNRNSTNEMPCHGSIAAKVCGPRREGLPAYVAVPEPPGSGHAAYLGAACNPFTVGGDPNEAGYQVRDLAPATGVSLERLADRANLRAKLDRMRREVDQSGKMDGLDAFHHKAFEMVSSPAAVQAFDLSRESDQTRERYGRTTFGQSMLFARRLVEAGVTFVTVKNNGWDTHQTNFPTLKDSKLPELDRPWAALLEDLSERGMLDNTLVIQMGEFGRSWFVSQQAGREHWPQCYSVLLAGGGLKTGQVIGASDSRGAYPVERPIPPEDLLATLYHVLGIDTSIEFLNESLRPFKVLSGGRPIRELVG